MSRETLDNASGFGRVREFVKHSIAVLISTQYTEISQIVQFLLDGSSLSSDALSDL